MSLKMKEIGALKSTGKLRKRMEHSKRDYERDSGFSDVSSEHLSKVYQIDTENTAHPAVPGRSTPRPQTSQMAVVDGSFPGLSPMIIMNNVLLKQPGENPPSLKPWGFSPTVEMVQQPQVVFLQPMVSQRPATVPKAPATKRRRHKKYLPILKSYPKIAPHPAENSWNSGSTCSSRNSSTASSLKSCSSASSNAEKPHRNKQLGPQTPTTATSLLTPPRSLPASPQPHSCLTDNSTSSCALIDRLKPTPSTQELPLLLKSDQHTMASQSQSLLLSEDNSCHSSGFISDASDCSNKRKRFCNTYNILRDSGLLDITLRTKDLLRHNRRTQTELDWLREHTNLFMEALQTGDSKLWAKLQKNMQEEERERENEKTVQSYAKMETE